MDKKKFELTDITKEKISFILFIICALTFLFMAVYQIARPGVQYDEILFENAALGAKTDQFVSKRIFGIPFMLMPYIGALKAYIYMPIFWLFGVSAASIRLPMILMSTMTLWFVYQLTKRLTKNVWLSNITVALFSTSLCMIISSKLDMGPFAIMMFLLILALWAFFRFFDTHRLLYFYILLSALLLGIYDKSNFIWFSSAFGLSALTVYRKEFILISRELKGQFNVPFVAFLIFMCMYTIFSVLPLMGLDVNSASSRSINLQRIHDVYHGINITLTGSSYTGNLLNTPMEFSIFKNQIVVFSYFLSLIFLGLWFIPYFRKRMFSELKEHMNGLAFFCFISVIIFAEMILTRQAAAAHHFIMLLPFTVFVTVLCGNTLINIIQNRIVHKIITVAFYTIVAAILILNLRADIWFLRYIGNEKSIYSKNWDPAIYELSEYTHNTRIKNIYSIDWGIHNQLHAFDPDRDQKNYLDMIWYFNDYHNKTEEEKEWYFDTFFDKPEILFVGHGSETINLVNASEGFETFVKESLTDGTFEKIHSIQNAQGQELFQVFKFSE